MDNFVLFCSTFSDVVPIDGAEMAENILPSRLHLVCCPFLIIVEDVLSKFTAYKFIFIQCRGVMAATSDLATGSSSTLATTVYTLSSSTNHIVV